MQLFGSTTSPYVRRLRLFMQDFAHEFTLIDVFNSRDRAKILADNPTLKIPMLKDGSQTIFDSGTIYRYLQAKIGAGELTWDKQNILTSIDAANDSLVQMLILGRSEIDTSADKLYFRVQRERLDAVFAHLEQQAKSGAFVQWDYVSMSLFCLVDWTLFRQTYNITRFVTLLSLHEQWRQLAICHQTDPRL
ncbi:MAG: glutathione S-transferase [Patiriisocius sp.]|jgi:glutathione S-transferase